MDRHLSPWVATMPSPPLDDTRFRRVDVDVVIVGGGITGMTTALLLQQEGMRTAVIEAERFGARCVTTHSTVKLTVGHGTVYSMIEDARGFEAAETYAEANAVGFDKVVELIDTHGIDCRLELGLPHVVYTEDVDEAASVEREARLAARLGLPAALTTEAPLPFPVAAAVRFADQAQFHPGEYLVGLARAYLDAGGTVMESVRVRDVHEGVDGCEVETTDGVLEAGHVVVATHYPILDRGGQFSQLTARRSYGVAGVLPPDVEAGMTISAGSPRRSTRTAHLGGDDLLVVVGEGHRVGGVDDAAERPERLRQWAREHFGVHDFRYHWSSQETTSLDHVPFVGLVSPIAQRVLIATGFDGWGMTNGTASAVLVNDLLLGRGNPWADVFDARRAETTLPTPEALGHNIEVGKTWLKDRIVPTRSASPEDLEEDSAAVMEVDGEAVAAYRDREGRLHTVSAVCTHLGCNVDWNGAERSWDCPCHGSRFTPEGDILHGPATTPLPSRATDRR